MASDTKSLEIGSRAEHSRIISDVFCPGSRLFPDGVNMVGHNLFEGIPLQALLALALARVSFLCLLAALPC
jgi:hypothetical protein